MKTTLNGKTYDTDAASEITMHTTSAGENKLYQTHDGEFFLVEQTCSLDGRKLKPWESPEALAPELDDAHPHVRRSRIQFEEAIVTLSTRAAMEWCIKTQIPECFRGYLLASI